MASTAQRKLEFQVRKSSRITKKAETPETRESRASRRRNITEQDATPTTPRSTRNRRQVSKQEKKDTPQKETKADNNLSSPAKKLDPMRHLSSPRKCFLSPEKIQEIAESICSPSKRCVEGKSFSVKPINAQSLITANSLKSPRVKPAPSTPTKDSSGRLPLSPRKCNFSSPSRENIMVNASPRKRELSFAETSRVPQLSSPSKRKKENCVVVPSSPARGSLGLKTPPRPVSSWRVATPVERSPACRRILSPPASPRAGSRITGNTTPQKVTPLRLVRQEGECYQKAKKALHTALPERVLCREKESDVVRAFLDKHLRQKKGGSLYISGAPGTGKTVVLSHMINTLKEEGIECQTVFINCMTGTSAQVIYNKVLQEVTGKADAHKTAKEAVKALEKSFTTKGKMIVMILDEIDQLSTKDQHILYTMFEWPSLNKSRLVLVGIANALDLTDRILPRLQARPKCRPELLHFPPYSKDQIVTILQDRLDKAQIDGTVVDKMAVQFCARKVSAVAGDMRKALDVCRRAVEKVESEVRSQQVLKPKCGLNSPRKTPQKAPALKKISIPQIASVVSEVYGSGAMTNSSAEQTIPLQQKIAVCSLLLLIKTGKSKEITLGKLHETYTKICRKRKMMGIDQSEFLGLCGLIETRGIIQMKKHKETRMSKVVMKLDEKEVEFALQDKRLMSTILEEGL